jgi:hypothetical protein
MRRFVPLFCGLLSAAGLAAADTPGLESKPLAAPSGPAGATLFQVVNPADSGLLAPNNYAEPGVLPDGRRDPRVWADRYHVLDVGAIGTGVAIGDYDGDGRPDVFVVSKTESCHLFRNLGGWKFEDVTAKAGVEDQGQAATIWKQGATFADVNNDGLLDIYVCRFGAPNLLYINQGDGTFKEEAAKRGLAVNDASVMGAFCDYDRDGWLDVFVQTNLLDGVAHPNGQPNYLFHNNRDGTFTDVTAKSGIAGEAQGHSATWWDYDGDGWPDLYVCNDFAAPDRLYRNNRDGTFTEVIDTAVPHMPFSAMGSDAGDVDNDGRVDLLAADMAASTQQKDQRGMANMRDLATEPAEGTSPQLLRNALYLATGGPRLREAACLTGLDATDWTWAVRFEDLDNDGRLDLFVTNGMHREAHNTDMLTRVMVAENAAQKVQIEKASPVLRETHLAYRNLGGLRFEEVGAKWGLNDKGVSFGAAFGDLDGDGDFDLVYTNYQQPATVLRNDSGGHRILFDLRGTASNRFGIGATVRIQTAAGLQVRTLGLARGLLSSSEPVVHFGLGEQTTISRVDVEWPSGRRQVFTDLAADRRYTITEPAEGTSVAAPAVPAPQFTEMAASANLSWKFREANVDELSSQPQLPFRQNRRGPALAVGDVSGDGRYDVLVGGTATDAGLVLRATGAGRFGGEAIPNAGAERAVNDGPVLLFDADGDGRNDLLVTHSGAALPAGSAGYQPQLLLNDGHGGWRAAPDALPALTMSVGAACAADFNHDGRLDVFLGARVTPGMYPYAPRSALLLNRGGRFEDVTDTLAPGLREVGLVTAALWSDADGDGWPDLLVTCEWGTVRYFHNDQGRGFTDWTERAGFAAAGTGWWTSLATADFNGDGRPDYVAGNVGLNTTYRATADHPALLYAGDFTGGGGLQLVEAWYEGDKLYPRRSRRTLGAAIPSVLKRYARNDFYARATLGEIVGEDKLAAADRFAATQFESGVFLSQADGTWKFSPLPRVAQIAPLQGLLAGDFDGDGHADIFAVQNSYAPVASIGHFDGGLGQLLSGDGHGGFAAIPPAQSGLIVPGDAKALVGLDLNGDGWLDFVVSRNQDTTLAFRNAGMARRHGLIVSARGPAGNPAAIGARLTLELSDGSKQTTELSAGSSYFSQSAPVAAFGWPDGNPPRVLRVRWPDGHESSPTIPAGATTLVVPPDGSVH